MLKLFLLLNLITTSFASEPLKVAVIDTGLNIEDGRFNYLICDYKDLTNTSINDVVGHGTHVAGLIKQYAEKANFCFIIIKYYLQNDKGINNQRRFIEGISYALEKNAKIVNISAGGGNFDELERNLIQSRLDVIFVIAIGNDSQDLDQNCCYFPACYKLSNIITVGALDETGKSRLDSSNYGNIVKSWEIGERVFSTLPQKECTNICINNTGYMSGTSMAAAIHTGKLVHEISH